VKSRRLNTKSANVLENPLKKIYYYEITKLIGMFCVLYVYYYLLVCLVADVVHKNTMVSREK
jgi:energy-converting hydrogenase Eha subunit C